MTPWTTQSIEFSRPEYWSGEPFPSPRDLPTQGSNPGLLHCRQSLYQLRHKGSPNFVQRRGKKKSDTCSLFPPAAEERKNVWHLQPTSSVWRPLTFLPITLSRPTAQTPVSCIAGGFYAVQDTKEAWNRLCRVLHCTLGPCCLYISLRRLTAKPATPSVSLALYSRGTQESVPWVWARFHLADMLTCVVFQIQRLSDSILCSLSSLYKDQFQTAMFHKLLLTVILAVMKLLLILLSTLSATLLVCCVFFFLTVIHSTIQRESSISHIWIACSKTAKGPGVWKWDAGPRSTGNSSTIRSTCDHECVQTYRNICRLH